jgi:glyoxylase-like metal-dependent hydrolase (beta-lactamase superfamily II)
MKLSCILLAGFLASAAGAACTLSTGGAGYMSPNLLICQPVRGLHESCNVVRVCDSGLVCKVPSGQTHKQCIVNKYDFRPLNYTDAYPGGVYPDYTKGYKIKETGVPGVVAVWDGAFFMLLAYDDNNAVLVDAQDQMKTTTYTAIANEVLGPGRAITHFIYTHSHFDHTGSAGKVKEAFPNVQYIAHKDVAAKLIAIKDLNRPWTFTNEHILQDDSGTIVIGTMSLNYLVTAGHSAGNIVILTKRVLYSVDIIWPGFSPYLYMGFLPEVDMNKYKEGVLQLKELQDTDQFDVHVTGHYTKFGSPGDWQVNLDFSDALILAGYNALEGVSYMEVTAAGGVPGYDVCGNSVVFRDALLAHCVAEMLVEWEDEANSWSYKHNNIGMQGVDAAIEAHCLVGIWSHTMEGPQGGSLEYVKKYVTGKE